MKPQNSLDNLIQKYIDQQIDANELEELNSQLQQDAQARKHFTEVLNLDSALGEISAAHLLENDVLTAEPVLQQTTFFSRRTSNDRFKTTFVFTVIASLILLLTGIWWSVSSSPYFSIVTIAAGVQELTEGSHIGNQPISISAGSLEIVTTRGARIAIEAPAQFQFESAQRLHLFSGRLSADVPPSATGFTVITPTGEAVDLGTKFGIDISETGTAEVHVFEGEVIAQSANGGNRQNLRDGEAFQFQKGAGVSRDFRSSAFIRPEEVSSLRAALEHGQQNISQQALESLKNDLDLIALLDFESGQPPEGTFQMTQGRWPGSHAPEFINVGDHIKLDVGGEREWPQFTLAAWVRIDKLGDPFQSFLHTDGWGAHDGQVHWMVTHHSTMRLALFGNRLSPESKNRDKYPDSLTSVLPQQGRWVHLAVVYDAEARTVRFYFNGQFDKQEQLELAHPARFGPAQIGNWNQKDRKLSGRMDELLILGRAMTDEQIQSLFTSGNPYR